MKEDEFSKILLKLVCKDENQVRKFHNLVWDSFKDDGIHKRVLEFIDENGIYSKESSDNFFSIIRKALPSGIKYLKNHPNVSYAEIIVLKTNLYDSYFEQIP